MKLEDIFVQIKKECFLMMREEIRISSKKIKFLNFKINKLTSLIKNKDELNKNMENDYKLHLCLFGNCNCCKKIINESNDDLEQ